MLEQHPVNSSPWKMPDFSFFLFGSSHSKYKLSLGSFFRVTIGLRSKEKMRLGKSLWRRLGSKMVPAVSRTVPAPSLSESMAQQGDPLQGGGAFLPKGSQREPAMRQHTRFATSGELGLTVQHP